MLHTCCSAYDPNATTWEENHGYRAVLGGADHLLSQASGVEDELFKGKVLGKTADFASGALRESEVRSLEHLSNDYHIPSSFLDVFAVHMVKNCLEGSIDGRVPLILGIWGAKGCGKSMNVELCCKRLGVAPIVVSAGELEDPWAGQPGKRLRERYRVAAEVMQTQGRPACLIINDLDAGAGRVKHTTGYTVNTQLVSATLMNLADHPTDVQVRERWVASRLPRVPIIVTANDLSTLYAPLIRDGRMEKFYWSPTFQDRVGVACGIFKADGVNANDVEVLVRTFDGQSIDFFGALRARVYDDKVRAWIKEVGIDAMGSYLINPSKDKGKVQFEAPRMSLDILLQYGKMLEQEQENVNRVQLADAYLDGAVLAGQSGSSNTPQSSLMN